MCSDVAIRVEGLSKCYHIYDRPQDRLKQALMPRLQQTLGMQPRQYFREFWALRDVSFEIRAGETAGILGRNGSGKSTLLQLICGTLSPTAGQVQTQGRIAALLELGSGFNPEFTGRENVFLNATILGMTEEETAERFDEIAAFADIGDHLDQPVKTYSSGMYVRLAFAVNIMSRPRIMVVDEALAVGDMNFQAKCMTALARIQDSGATVLFVSHDIGSIRSLCNKAIYLEHGRLVSQGAAPRIAEEYVRNMRQEMSAEVRRYARTSEPLALSRNDRESGAVANETAADGTLAFIDSADFASRVATHRYGAGGARICAVELLDKQGEVTSFVDFNDEVCLRIHLEADCDRPVSVNFAILDDKKINIIGSGFGQAGRDLLNLTPGMRRIVEYRLRLPLRDGNYSVRAQVAAPIVRDETSDYLDVVEDAVVFQVAKWDRARIWSKVHVFPSLRVCEPAEAVPSN
ncbi:MAG: ABC transporter ATP-binding protein [Burkholderiaceae bacterium]